MTADPFHQDQGLAGAVVITIGRSARGRQVDESAHFVDEGVLGID